MNKEDVLKLISKKIVDDYDYTIIENENVIVIKGSE